MIVSAIVVISVDGAITRHDESSIYGWTSTEDKQFFQRFLHKQDVVIMGRTTYRVVRNHINPSGRPLRVILTHHPHLYRAEARAGKLVFTSEKVDTLLESLENSGNKRIAVVGGTEVYNEFFRRNLINRLYVTVEPQLFGTGKKILSIPVSAKLELLKQEIINNEGTLLLSYNVKTP